MGQEGAIVFSMKRIRYGAPWVGSGGAALTPPPMNVETLPYATAFTMHVAVWIAICPFVGRRPGLIWRSGVTPNRCLHFMVASRILAPATEPVAERFAPNVPRLSTWTPFAYSATTET